ncbi:MAG: hypothetical protein WDN69_33615 [Aliidongia sp.]
MIDNLVQIGHNVVLGRCCVIAAQTGISGSTRLGDFVGARRPGRLGRPSVDRDGRPDRRAERCDAGTYRPARKWLARRRYQGRQWLRQSAILDRLATKKDK